MSAILQYLGERNIGGLKTELDEKGYRIDLLGKEHAAVSSVAAIKSMKPMILQDVIEELKDLKYGKLLTAFVYSRPEKAEIRLEQLLTPERLG
ncbi:MAG: hypothetical protein NT016_00870 [Candidatus Aenigmarchaeota archaeon]|nr:hypothetical protein [Candidatus Aenigmarchaeota archaeon]